MYCTEQYKGQEEDYIPWTVGLYKTCSAYIGIYSAQKFLLLESTNSGIVDSSTIRRRAMYLPIGRR